MAVTCGGGNRVLTLTLSGEIDHHSAREMMAEMDAYVEAQLPRSLTVDLGEVTFMDSSGIAVLIRVYRRVWALGGTVTVCNIPPQPRKVLRAAGLEKLMKFQ